MTQETLTKEQIPEGWGKCSVCGALYSGFHGCSFTVGGEPPTSKNDLYSVADLIDVANNGPSEHERKLARTALRALDAALRGTDETTERQGRCEKTHNGIHVVDLSGAHGITCSACGAKLRVQR